MLEKAKAILSAFFEKAKKSFRSAKEKILNRFCFLKESVASWWQKIFAAKEHANASEGNNWQEDFRTYESKPKKGGGKFFFTHFCDIIASLIFFASVLIALKLTLFNHTAVGIALFVLFKLIVIFSSHSPIKIVSILILVLSVLTCILVKEKFLLFLPCILVLYFAFEFSCGFKWKTICPKFIAIIVSFLFEYFALHFILVDGLLKQFAIHGIKWW